MPLEITLEHLESLIPFFKGKPGISGSAIREPHVSLSQLIHGHFAEHAAPDHANKASLSNALALLGERPAYIVETGSAAWGAKSTLLFDSYVNSFGGQLDSVDIRLEPAYTLSRQCSSKTKVFCDDSLNFLKHLDDKRVDLYYLDSFDLDPSDPLPSMMHGLQEFLLILPRLRRYGGYVLIDDTPRDQQAWETVQGQQFSSLLDKHRVNYGVYPGKGALVASHLMHSTGCEILWWDYQLMINIKPSG